jgi:hypothetical protein
MLFSYLFLKADAPLIYWTFGQWLSGMVCGATLVYLVNCSNLLQNYQPTLLDFHRAKKILAHPLNIFVAYALFDFIWTLIRISIEREGTDLDYVDTPLQRAVIGPGVLLVSAIALRLNRIWSLPIAIAVSGKLLREGWQDYQYISESFSLHSEVPKPITETLQFWWCYQGGRWQIPRLMIAAVMLLCAVVLLIRKIGQRWRQSNPAVD